MRVTQQSYFSLRWHAKYVPVDYAPISLGPLEGTLLREPGVAPWKRDFELDGTGAKKEDKMNGWIIYMESSLT